MMIYPDVKFASDETQITRYAYFCVWLASADHSFCPNEAFGTFYYLRTHCTFHYFICCEMIAACKLHVDYLKRFSNALVVKHKIHTYIMNQIIFLFYMRKNIIRKFNSLTKCKTLASLESLDPKARALPLCYSTFNSR